MKMFHQGYQKGKVLVLAKKPKGLGMLIEGEGVFSIPASIRTSQNLAKRLKEGDEVLYKANKEREIEEILIQVYP